MDIFFLCTSTAVLVHKENKKKFKVSNTYEVLCVQKSAETMVTLALTY